MVVCEIATVAVVMAVIQTVMFILRYWLELIALLVTVMVVALLLWKGCPLLVQKYKGREERKHDAGTTEDNPAAQRPASRLPTYDQTDNPVAASPSTVQSTAHPTAQDREWFAKLDEDESGLLSKTEAKAMMLDFIQAGDYAITEAWFEGIWRVVDVDDNDELDIHEFAELMKLVSRQHNSKRNVGQPTDEDRALFKQLDKNGDGKLGQKECFALIKSKQYIVTEKYLCANWRVLDKDGNGCLDLEEFASMMKNVRAKDMGEV
jgi:Ca2+-binding EF-hand superfamily protein